MFKSNESRNFTNEMKKIANEIYGKEDFEDELTGLFDKREKNIVKLIYLYKEKYEYNKSVKELEKYIQECPSFSNCKRGANPTHCPNFESAVELLHEYIKREIKQESILN